jgi:hypothetical protein
MKKRSECTCMCHTNNHIRHVVACCHEDVMEEVNFPSRQDMIGEREEDVIEKIEKAGMKYRIMKKDGESFMGTMDFDPMRFNLTIENGIVTNIEMN